MNHKILIIGAGKTGRGFLPQYIYPKDQILFIDKNQELIRRLANSKSYKISYYGDEKEAVEIQNYQAFSTTIDQYKYCISECDMIAISIGIENYDELVEDLKPHLDMLKEKVIVTFENSLNAAQTLETLLKLSGIKVTEGSVFCTTNVMNEIDIISQNLCYLPIKDKYLDNIYLNQITPISNFYAFMERKLYTYNLLSAILSYEGYVKGYVWLHEAANDKQIMKDANEVMENLNPILANYFHVSIEEQTSFSKAAIVKFSNCYIKDSIQRNCRNVERKLGKDERIMKPLQLLENANQDVSILLKIIAMALVYEQREESGKGIEIIDHLDFIKNLYDKINNYYKILIQ